MKKFKISHYEGGPLRSGDKEMTPKQFERWYFKLRKQGKDPVIFLELTE